MIELSTSRFLEGDDSRNFRLEPVPLRLPHQNVKILSRIGALNMHMVKKTEERKDILVSSEVYWHLVKLKFDGHYRSIDEVLRPMLGLPAGPRPHVKFYADLMEDRTSITTFREFAPCSNMHEPGS